MIKKLLWFGLGSIVLAACGLFLWREASGLNDGMDFARSEIHAAVLGDKIYVAGGIGLFRVLDQCERFDVALKQWERCASLPRPLHHVAMAADDKRVYASGGYVSLPFEADRDAALFAYDPATNKWEEIAKLPHPIGQHVMTYKDGALYLIGGQNDGTDLDTLWSYNIASGQWTALSAMPTARHSHAIAVSAEKIYISGGRSNSLGSEIDIVEAFDFTTMTWKALPKMPLGTAGHGSFVSRNKLHVFGGETLTENRLETAHHMLDLTTLEWTNAEPLKQARHGFAIGDAPTLDKVYIIGGGAHPGMQTIYSVTSTLQTLPK